MALWVVQIALAGMFLLAGGSKLLGAPAMVALFNTIGMGQWFRYPFAGTLWGIGAILVAIAGALVQLAQRHPSATAGRVSTPA